MRRREFLAAAGLVGIAGCLEGTASTGGEGLAYGGMGIRETSWTITDTEDYRYAFVIEYGESPPEFVRLVTPGGTEVWRQEEPTEGGVDELEFKAPMKRTGEWGLSSTKNGESRNQPLDWQRDLFITKIDLDIDTITVAAKNTGTIPNVWQNYIISTQIHTETMGVGKLLLPGESHEVSHEYPFDKYKGIGFWLYDGEDTYDKQKRDLA